MLGTTRWSLVRRAMAGGEALEAWVEASWYPLYCWARQKGWSPEDAADAVQEFLGKICNRQLLKQVNPARGRLRSWLLGAFGNHLASQVVRSRRLKRGGGARHLSTDWEGFERSYQLESRNQPDADRLYARAWALSVMEEAMRRLAEHFANGGREALFEALLPALEAPLENATYAEVAVELEMSGAALRQAAVRFRKRYRSLLLEVAGECLGLTGEAVVEQELRELLGG